MISTALTTRARRRLPRAWTRARRRRERLQPALVLGDIDMVYALREAGIPGALMAVPGDPGRRSRMVSDVLRWADPWERPEDLVAIVLEWARRQDEPPVLLPQADGELLAVSRHRRELAASCRFLLAGEQLVEDLLDKGRFSALAERLDLPVPRARIVSPGQVRSVAELGLRPPLIVKPAHRDHARWLPIEPSGKARSVADERELDQLLGLLDRHPVEVLLQERIPGAETRIESHHVYVDADGRVVAEFTGQKIRTLPLEYGFSTAVRITASADVAALGREVSARLGLRGIAKLDFKRDTQGRLHLLEVNPRVSLWNWPGAVAGVNLPALLHADLTGRPRPQSGPVRPGVTWSHPLYDLYAARTAGEPMRRWLRFIARCDCRSLMRATDPLPAIALTWPRVRRALLP